MAEEINELTKPKDITDEAVLEMFNLWQANYKVNDTVDPESDLPVSSKAVAKMLQSLIGKPIRVTPVFDDIGFCSIPIGDMINTDKDGIQYIEFEVYTPSGMIELHPESGANYGEMFSLDSGKRIRMKLTGYTPPTTQYDFSPYMRILHWIELKPSYDRKAVISFINRRVYLNGSPNVPMSEWTLRIGNAHRGYVSGTVDTTNTKVDASNNDTTENQEKKTQPNEIIFYKY